MKQRCGNPNNNVYEYYGGRGIKVCDEWDKNYTTFESWALKQGYDPESPRGKCTVDRINNDGDYCPDNCRIVDMKTQCSNRRRPENWKQL